MSQHFTNEMARMRTDELIAKADNYRLMKEARSNGSPKEVRRVRRAALPVYRRVLAAFGLSIVMLVATAALALARPTGPGPASDPGSSDSLLRRQGPVEQFQPAPASIESEDSDGIPAIATGALVGLVLVTGTIAVVMRRKQEPSTV